MAVWLFGTGVAYIRALFLNWTCHGVMGALGYVSNLGTIGQSLQTSHNMCWLVAGLYLFSALVQFIGLALIYNLDKKKLSQMKEELAVRHASSNK